MGTIQADDWELRCRLRHSKYLENKDRYDALDHDVPPAPEFNQPPGTISRTTYYFKKGTKSEVFRTHRYILTDEEAKKRKWGQPWPDPKAIKIGLLTFVQKGGPKIKRDPAEGFSDKTKKKNYMSYRRWICEKVGPNADAILSFVFQPNFLERLWTRFSGGKEYVSSPLAGA
jgi:hypothetical protein